MDFFPIMIEAYYLWKMSSYHQFSSWTLFHFLHFLPSFLFFHSQTFREKTLWISNQRPRETQVSRTIRRCAERMRSNKMSQDGRGRNSKIHRALFHIYELLFRFAVHCAPTLQRFCANNCFGWVANKSFQFSAQTLYIIRAGYCKLAWFAVQRKLLHLNLASSWFAWDAVLKYSSQ